MALQDVAHVETAEVHRGETSLAGAASGFFLPGGLTLENCPLAEKWIPDPRTFSRALSSIIHSSFSFPGAGGSATAYIARAQL